MISVLLVDDSPVTLAVLKGMLALSPDIEVAGTAANGKEALELIPVLKPGVICTDLHMPVMDGLALTKKIMARYPTPILLVSVSGLEESLNAFKVLEAGAVDLFCKPRGGETIEDMKNVASELIRKIRIVSGVKVFRKMSGFEAHFPELKKEKPTFQIPSSKIRILVLGASTGGPQALHTILSQLPHDYPLPVVCIQHIAEGFLDGLVEWLASQCRVKIKISSPGELPVPGVIYFPREGEHLRIGADGRFVHSAEPPLDGHRPSITVAMQSLARYYGNGVLSVLLTGMGRDGAEGMRVIAQAGGVTIAQDEQSSVVFGMPKQAIELNVVKYVMPLEEIAQVISSLANNQTGVWINGWKEAGK